MKFIATIKIRFIESPHNFIFAHTAKYAQKCI